MKTDNYKNPIKREVVEVDDNIKMEGPDEIATDMAKNNFDKEGNTEVCHVCAKEFWGRLSLLQHMKYLLSVINARKLLQRRVV